MSSAHGPSSGLGRSTPQVAVMAASAWPSGPRAPGALPSLAQYTPQALFSPLYTCHCFGNSPFKTVHYTDGIICFLAGDAEGLVALKGYERLHLKGISINLMNLNIEKTRK